MLSSLFRQTGRHDLALDKVIAITGLCIGIALTALSISLKYLTVTIPSVVLVSSLFYLLLRKRLSTGEELLQFRLGNRIWLLSQIVFIISLFFSIWFLWSNLYYRPPIYFILVLVAVASIITDVFALDEAKRSHTSVLLCKIIALSVTIYAGIYYQFPGIYGVDAWMHNAMIQETIGLGHIPEAQFTTNSYFLFPVFHLAGAITQIITRVSVYTAVFITTGVLMAISCLFVFLIGRKLVGPKLGLLAMLIVLLAAETIERATAIIAMSLGFCFFSAILYLVLCRDGRGISNRLLFILLSLTLIFTHTIAALAMLVTLIAIFVGNSIYNLKSNPLFQEKSVSLTHIAFFGVAMLTRWLQNPPEEPAFFDLSFVHLVNTLSGGDEFVSTTHVANVSYIVSFLDQGGYLLVLACAIVSAFIFLHPKNRTKTGMALVLTVATLSALPYSFMLFSLENILPSRWFLFLYVPLSILAVYGLSCVSNLAKRTVAKQGMIMIVILAVIFMTTTNSVANDDSPQVFNGAVRIGYTQSELTAIQTLSDMRCGCPETDLYYGNIFPYVIGLDKYMDMVQGDTGIFVYRNYYLHHSDWNQQYITRIHQGGIGNYGREQVLLSEYMERQAIDECPFIYVNGDVGVYTTASTK